MEKRILLFSVFIICVTTSTTNLFAQGAITATWALTSNLTCAATGAGASTIATQASTVGSSIINNGNNSSGLKLSITSSTNWPSSVNATYYEDFPITVNSGYTLNITSIAAGFAVTGGSGSLLGSFQYSLDGGTTFTAITPAQSFPSSSGSSSPVSVTTSFSTTSTQTLTIRMYIYSSGTVTGSRSVYVKNVVVSGTTTASTVLPVAFADVQASQKNGGITVEWSAITEVNTDKYVVQKSLDGSSFTDAASVAARGTGGVANQYSWFDATPSANTNFYRIKAVDKDGGFAYSSTIKINSNAINPGSLVIAPNPVINRQVNLQLSSLNRGNYSLNVYSVTGQLVFTKSISYEGGVSSFLLSLPATVNKGMYSVQLSNEATRITKQIVIQ